MSICTLHLITGRAGSGRTTRLVEAVIADMRAGRRALYIVPEQHTFEAEQRLAAAAGGAGILGIQVLSMERLAERTLEKGGDRRSFLHPQGVQMLIRCAAHRHRDELRSFGRTAESRGFAAEMAALIASLKQADITAEQLTEAVDAMEGQEMLKEKLSDVALLYRELDAMMEARYLTMDDALTKAIPLLGASDAAGVPVYVDGLSAVTGQVLHFLDALMGVASEMTVALCHDRDGADAEVFEANDQACGRLVDMAERHGASVARQHIVDPGHRQAAPELKYLEGNLFRAKCEPFQGAAGGVVIHETLDRMAEVRALINTVLTLARGGMRYRDMAVVVSDAERYEAPVARLQQTYGVPVFVGGRRPVRGHAAAEVLFEAVRASGSGMAQQDMLSLAKNGYAGVPFADAAVLENYVLCFGIRGSQFASPFRKKDFPEYAVAEAARARLMEAFLPLHQALASPSDVHAKVQACYQYLMTLDVRKTLEKAANAALADGKAERAQELAQVWNALSGLLEEADTILGDTVMSREEFFCVLEEGLDGVTVGVVPTGEDSLEVTPLMRAGGGKVKALLMLGCTDGLLPRDRSGDGLLSDEEREYLRTELALEGLNGAGFYSAHERLTLYETLARPTEQLHFFYPIQGSDGEQLPSTLIARVKDCLPNAVCLSDTVPVTRPVTCRADAVRRLTDGLRDGASTREKREETAALKAYFETAEPQLMASLAMADQGGAQKNLSRELAGLLYGGHLRMSASRLEQFNGCPFRHFLNHGLRATVRQEYEEKPTDTGTLYHEILRLYLTRLKEEGISLEEGLARLDTLFEEVFEAALTEHNHGRLLEDPRLRIALGSLHDAARNSIKTVLGQLLAGGFTPLGTEMAFDDPQHTEDAAFPPIRFTTRDGHEVTLHGIVDRVDTAGSLARVVDYKTHGKDLDPAAVQDGLQLQLPLYLYAVLQGEGAGAKGAGMYYMRIQLPAVEETDPPEKALEEQMKKGKLSGALLDDADAILMTDHVVGTEAGGRYSMVVKGLEVTKKGVSGPKVSEREMRTLMDMALRKSAATVEEMLSGDIQASPMGKACDWCEYQSVCCFDTRLSRCRVRAQTPKTTVDRFFQSAREEDDR